MTDPRIEKFTQALRALERTASATCWTGDERAAVLALYAAALAVKVPAEKTLPDVYAAEYHESKVWNACRSEVLRLNGETK